MGKIIPTESSKPQSLRVLMVEDSQDDALLMIRELKKGGYQPSYERVETAAAMKKALQEKPWDIILCDYNLPQFSAPSAIAMLKEMDIDIPLIIVSGAIDEETAVESMRLGAQDFIMKGKLSRLCPAIARELKEAEFRVQRKQADEALREREERLQKIFENAEEIIHMISWDGTFLYISPSWERFTGFSVSETVGKSFVNYVHPEDAPACLEVVKNVRETGQPHRIMEFRVKHASGKWIWFTNSGVAIKDGQGTPLYFMGVATDITERKQTEEALRESEKKYRGILANMDDAYYEVDLKGNYVFFNEAMAQNTGYSWEEISGMNYRQLMTPETVRQVRDAFQCVYQTGKTAHLLESRMRRKDGSLRDLEIWVSPIFDKNNQTIGFKGMAHDITNRKLAEKNLQDTLESLRKSFATTIQVMVSAVESRDPYTAGHQTRSANLARAIATEMGFPKEKIEGIRMAGIIHDIGKLSIPSEILTKPTRLTSLEFSLIKEHSQRGFEMLKDVESPWPLAQIVYQHHERMDGSGYPRNLKGDEILMEARILAVADVVEAMASHRPYRPSLGLKSALEEIEKNKGTLYDAEAVDACLRLFREKGFQLEGE